MLTLLALVTLSQNGKFAIPCMVAPASRLIPEVGRKLGIKLIAGSSTKDDVLAISSPPRPAQDLLDGIATAANATWEKRPEGLVLVRSRRQAQDDEATEAKYRAQLIREALKSIPTDKAFDKNAAVALATYRREFKETIESDPRRSRELGPMNGRSPVGRFSRRLIEAMGPETLAALPVGQRTVFSDKPNRMQKPLPFKGIGPIIDQLRTEQARYVAELENHPAKPSPGQYASGFDYINEIPKTYGKVLISVVPRPQGPITIYVHFLDAQGVAQGSVVSHITFYPDARDLASFASPRVELSQLSLLRSKVYRTNAPVAERAPFQDLVARDPLSFVHTEALQTWSRHSSKAIFALLPDKGASGLTEPLTLNVYRNSLAWYSTIQESSNQIVVRPKEPASASRFRADRKLLTDYIRMCVREGQATLAAQQVLALATPVPEGLSSEQFLTLALPFRSRQHIDLLYLRLFALATPTQQSALRSGRAINFGALPPEARQTAHRLIFDQSLSDVMLLFGLQRGGAKDITDQFPNGIPNGAALAVRATSAEGALIRSAGSERFLDARALATLMRQPSNQCPTEFCFTVQNKIEIELSVFPNQTRIFTDETKGRKGSWGSYAALPEDFRARVQRATGGD
ncbi:MAG: hypothetical protein IT363_03895 [Methanoregulaceae archaeon]|nr:hypothetical protein [Methanoregulaceae archaeon]